MMTQIKSSQIIPFRVVEANPSVSPPRDLQINADQVMPVLNTTTGITILNPSATSITGNAPAQSDSAITQDISNQVRIPDVPIIMAVNQQVVIGGDGKSTIDLTVTLKDIPGINEFDIRVARNAGTL